MVFVISELGVNWRNLDEADKMIMGCADADSDAVKFQMYLPEHVKGHPRECELTNILLTESDIHYLFWRCRAHGVEFMCTPFYEKAVDILNPFVKRWKVRYDDHYNADLINKIFATGKETLMSCEDLPACADSLRKENKVKFMYCVPEYPPKHSPLMGEGKGFDGFSSHYPVTGIPVKMVKDYNLEYLEVHVKMNDYNPPYCPIDNAVSITVMELEELVARIR
jgi:hypothetical protein